MVSTIRFAWLCICDYCKIPPMNSGNDNTVPSKIFVLIPLSHCILPQNRVIAVSHYNESVII